MIRFLRPALLAVSLFASCCVLAQSPVGNWTGHLDLSQVKAKDAEEKRLVDSLRSQGFTTTVYLAIRADKTCTFTTPPFGNRATSKPQIGKWSQKSHTIVFNVGGKIEKMTIAVDGKTMSFTAAPEKGTWSPKGERMVFRRS